MKQFFYFYTTTDAYADPFQMFSIRHVFFLLLVAFCVYNGIRYLKDRTPEEIHRFEKKLVTIFVLEEWFYYIWNIWQCPISPFTEILPLHLCSSCIYISAIAIYSDSEKLRRFMAVTNTLGATIALCYPATVNAAYPMFSYRVIYFFISHGTIIFLGILQIVRFGYLRYQDVKFNIKILAVVATLAFSANLWLHTDYMFVGTPPTIGIIRLIYETVGIYLYLPVAILLLFFLQLAATALINGVIHLSKQSLYVFGRRPVL